MTNGCKGFKQCIVLCFVLCAFVLHAEEKQFPQRIEWRSNANALEYKVEIQNTDTKKTTIITTEKTFAELSLDPGKYQYRVTAYDFLGRESDVSKWTKFDIIQAAQPQIRAVDKKVLLTKEGERLELNVDISNISADSVVELIGENVQGELGSGVKKGVEDETGNVSKLYFKNVPPGKWRLRVTNASGLSAESDVIEVEGKWTAQKELTEKERAAEEQRRLEYEKQQEELTAEAELKRRIAEAEAAQRRAEKEANPYVPKDIVLAVGAGFAFSLYDGTLAAYSDDAFTVAPSVRLSWLPFKSQTQKGGFELLGWRTEFASENNYIEAKLTFTQLGAQAVYQHQLFGAKSFVSLKGGGGVCLIDKHVSYVRGGEGRTPPEQKLFYYPSATAGVSIFFIPFTFLVAEFGVDFAHVFGSSSATGFIMPYASIGLRL